MNKNPTEDTLSCKGNKDYMVILFSYVFGRSHEKKSPLLFYEEGAGGMEVTERSGKGKVA